MNISKIFFYSSVLVGFLLGARSVSASDFLTEWKNYPSMDWRDTNNPFKVTQLCPTERYVYAVAHGNIYTTNRNENYSGSYGYNTNAYLNLFVYDTQEPSLGFRAANAVFGDVDGIGVSSIGYNKDKNYLLVGYQNGTLEMIYDDGRVKEMRDFKDAKIPGSKFINSISFCNELSEAYLATHNGYLVIDDSKGEFKEWVKVWGTLNYVNRVGNTLVAIAPIKVVKENGTEVSETTVVTYDMSSGKNPTDIVEFTPLELADKSSVPSVMINGATGHLRVSDGVLPLTDNTFATVGRTGASDANALSVITFTRTDNRTWKALTLVDSYIANYAADKIVFSPLMAAINNTRDGYSIKSQDFYLLKTGTDPDFTVSNPKEDYISKILTKIPFNISGEKYPCGGTFDGRTLWSFRTCGTSDLEGGFRRYSVDANSKVTLVEQSMIPDAPYGIFTLNMEYVPGHGMLVGGREYSLYFQMGTFGDYMSIFDGNNWKPYGLSVIQPSLSSVWESPYGMTVDPDNPKYVYHGGRNKGILRKNLEDPNDVLHITFGNAYNASRACDVEIIPSYTTNTGRQIPYVTRLCFDSAGRLWTFSMNSQNSSGKNLTFFYWDPEDRKASVDKASFRPWKTLEVPNAMVNSNRSAFLALKHEKNRNLLFLSDCQWSGGFILYDHKGTPDDTSDDRYVVMTNCVDDEGRSFDWDWIYGVEEDPIEGRIWLLTGLGLYWIDTATVFDNPYLLHRVELEKVNGVADKVKFCDTVFPSAYAVDSYGRKWFGTHGGGIYCLSPDNKEQIVHYNSSNSDLKNDVIYGLGWNPERNSLMISNGVCLQEMFVYEGGTTPEKGVQIYPAAVTPEYKGHVTISGLLDSADVEIRDVKGQTVIALGKPVDGRIQWNLRNSDRQDCKGGKYTVYNKVSGKNVGDILVVR